MSRTLNEILIDAMNMKLYDQLKKEEEKEHVCVFNPQDVDICRDCKEHASFCEECGSECCGATPYSLD